MLAFGDHAVTASSSLRNRARRSVLFSEFAGALTLQPAIEAIVKTAGSQIVRSSSRHRCAMWLNVSGPSRLGRSGTTRRLESISGMPCNDCASAAQSSIWQSCDGACAAGRACRALLALTKIALHVTHDLNSPAVTRNRTAITEHDEPAQCRALFECQSCAMQWPAHALSFLDGLQKRYTSICTRYNVLRDAWLS